MKVLKQLFLKVSAENQIKKYCQFIPYLLGVIGSFFVGYSTVKHLFNIELNSLNAIVNIFSVLWFSIIISFPILAFVTKVGNKTSYYHNSKKINKIINNYNHHLIKKCCNSENYNITLGIMNHIGYLFISNLRETFNYAKLMIYLILI